MLLINKHSPLKSLNCYLRAHPVSQAQIYPLTHLKPFKNIRLRYQTILDISKTKVCNFIHLTV